MSPEELQYNIIDYPADSTLVREGDEYGKLFVLLEGKCTVYTHGVEISSFDEKGACFGEMSMILNVPRTATVKAATDVKVSKPRTVTNFVISFMLAYPIVF